MACYCDYDLSPEFYQKRIYKARKEHKCYECVGTITIGETYESVSAKWDGYFGVYKTCHRCLDLREYTKAHVPCFCWYQGSMIDDAIETLRDYAHEAGGLLFGGYRRYIAIRSNK